MIRTPDTAPSAVEAAILDLLDNAGTDVDHDSDA